MACSSRLEELKHKNAAGVSDLQQSSVEEPLLCHLLCNLSKWQEQRVEGKWVFILTITAVEGIFGVEG